jgi:hypothetical protein
MALESQIRGLLYAQRVPVGNQNAHGSRICGPCASARSPRRGGRVGRAFYRGHLSEVEFRSTSPTDSVIRGSAIEVVLTVAGGAYSGARTPVNDLRELGKALARVEQSLPTAAVGAKAAA